VGGKRFVAVLATKEEAEDWIEETVKEQRARQEEGLPGPMRFSQLLDRFEKHPLGRLAPNTQRTYRSSLQAFRTYFVSLGKDPWAHKIRAGQVEGFLEWRETHLPDGTPLKKRSSPRVLAKDRSTLHRVFKYAFKMEIVPSNPVAKVEIPSGDARDPLILKPEQYEALIEACEHRPMLQTFITVLGESGLRCESEALWLRWEDINFQQNELAVETVRKGVRTKSGRSRRVPLSKRLSAALRAHAERFRMQLYSGKRSPWLFHHEIARGNCIPGERIVSFRASFDAAKKRAGLPADLHQHDLRHTRVTTWLEDGHPIHVVQHAMGHSTVKVTEGYLHLTSKSLQQLVEEGSAAMKEAARK
jgi:site-specific recombinase XerD